MLADLLTTETYDGQRHCSTCSPDPEWPAILAAFRRLDGSQSSWMTVSQGERQLSIGGGQRGYVVVAEAESEVLRGAPAQAEADLELWLNGQLRPCPQEHLLRYEHVLTALRAFVLAGQFSPQLRWQ
jgi:hypothetical protein